MPIDLHFGELQSAFDDACNYIDGEVTDTMRKAWHPYTLPFNLSGDPA